MTIPEYDADSTTTRGKPEAEAGSSPSTGYAAEQRERRKWWARVDNQVKEVTGYDCKPHSPKTWWCPEVSYSLHEGYQLFATEREALDKEIEKTIEEMELEKVRLANLGNVLAHCCCNLQSYSSKSRIDHLRSVKPVACAGVSPSVP